MRFWKMHGLGNDYVVIDNREEEIKKDELGETAQRICERRLSIGYSESTAYVDEIEEYI